MANSTTLTFAGDAGDLQKATKLATASLDDVNNAVKESSQVMDAAASTSVDYGTKMGHLGSAVSGATDALDAVGGSLTAINDLQQAGANRAAALRRALLAVESAQEDFNQAVRDGSRAQLDGNQATLDYEAAQLDAEEALNSYNEAVKEFGAGSLDARRAQLELKQAQQDQASATEDGLQSQRDAAAALIAQKTATEDLRDAQKAVNPPDLQKWADQLGLVTPLLSAVVGVIGLVAAAQWVWNASLWASPVTWIVVAVAAVVAGIVILAMHTEELGKLWDAVWGGITKAASWAWKQITAAGEEWWSRIKAIPDQLGNAFSRITGFILAPFKAGFNAVSDAWNNTIGRLSWTVPGWVPGVGGNSISAPRLPKYHQGGIVSGALGAETLAILQAGEMVTPAGGGGGPVELVLRSDGSAFADLVLKAIRDAVSRRGGDAARALGGDRY